MRCIWITLCILISVSYSAAIWAQGECPFAPGCVEVVGYGCAGGLPSTLPAICHEPCKHCDCPCVGGQFVMQLCPNPDGADDCDGNNCTSPDECQGGSCKPGPGCERNNHPEYPCTINFCPQNGQGCQYENAPAGTPCDNGNFCDGPDECNGFNGLCGPTPSLADAPCPIDFCEGTCNPVLDQCRPPPTCHETPNDNKCTRDWCENGSCRHENLVCNDQNACNGSEWCDPQTGCRSGEPLDCDDDNPCTDDWCDAASGCRHANNSRSCDDDNACTTDDRCQGGVCRDGPPRVCNDNNPCNGVEICCNGQLPLPCGGKYGCVKGTPMDCDDGLDCTIDRCDPAFVPNPCRHDCVPQPVPDGLIPKKDDRTFVYETDVRLVNGTYTYNDHLKVTRYAGPTNPSGGGPLIHAAALKTDGLATDAKLTIVAWGVQAGSFHAVYFNGGAKRGDLQASPDCTWSSTTFTIPLEQVNFPGERPPVGEPNEVKIVVGGSPICLRFRAAILSVKLMSPIILIHGNNSSAQFFVDEGFVGGLVNRKLLFDNSINMTTSSRELHGKELNDKIPPIAASFGVDGVHIVAHSKGGLDTREYLEKFQADHDSTFKVLSLTTLSTPHNGTVLADMAEARRSALSFAANVAYDNFPSFTLPLEMLDEVKGWFQRDDEGARADLTTSACVGFNGGNVRALKDTATTFVTIAGDADLSGNGTIETGEYPGLLIAEPWLANVPALSLTPTINTMYQIVRNTRAITLEYDTAYHFPYVWAYPTVVLIAVPASTPQLNDTLVSVRSGLGEPQLTTLTTASHRVVLLGQGGVDHGTVADGWVAEFVVMPILKGIEAASGDLR